MEKGEVEWIKNYYEKQKHEIEELAEFVGECDAKLALAKQKPSIFLIKDFLHKKCIDDTNKNISERHYILQQQKEGADEMPINFENIDIEFKDGTFREFATTIEYRFMFNGKQVPVYAKTRKECYYKRFKIIEQGYFEEKKKRKITIPIESEKKQELNYQNCIYFNDFMSVWLKTKFLEKLSPKYNKKLLKIVDSIKVFFANTKIEDLKAVLVQDFLDTFTNIDLQKRACQIIKQIVVKCVAYEKLKIDFSNSLSTAKQKKTIKLPYTVQEINTILSVIQGSPYRIFFIFLCSTGCRFSEALAIKKQDIVNNWLYINKSLDDDGTLKKPKTLSSTRKVPISDSLINLLNIVELNDDCFIFQFDKEAVKSYFRRVFEKTAFKGKALHTCRHTFISICQELDFPLKYVQRWVGHKQAETTLNIYTDLIDINTSCLIIDLIRPLLQIARLPKHFLNK